MIIFIYFVLPNKIIVKARKNYLFDEYVKKNHSLNKLVEDVNEALKLTEEKANNEQDKDKKEMFIRSINKTKETLQSIKDKKDVGEAQAQLLANSNDILSSWLDKLDGKNVTDNSIFNKVPRHYENEFHKDMAALNVKFCFILFSFMPKLESLG